LQDQPRQKKEVVDEQQHGEDGHPERKEIPQVAPQVPIE
jgi:hypothetical protein